jgi:hypothetical protein
MKQVLLLATALALAPVIACAADASGTWTLKAQGPKGGAMICKLTQSGTAVTGSCVVQDGSTVNVAGTVTGTDIDFGYDAAGSPLHVDIKGVIQPDGSIKGTLTPVLPSTPFVGTRQ